MTICFELSSVYVNGERFDHSLSVESVNEILDTYPRIDSTDPSGGSYFAHYDMSGITLIVNRFDDAIKQLNIKVADVEKMFLAKNPYSGDFYVNLGDLTNHETRIGIQNLGLLQFRYSSIGVVAFPSDNYAISMTGIDTNLDYISVSWNVDMFKRTLGSIRAENKND